MDTQQEITLCLWDYIDGNSAEPAAIEKLIAENAEWRSQYHELLEINAALTSSELEEPSLRFSKNIMEEVAKFRVAPAAKQYINNKVIWGIGGFFIATLAGLFIYAIGQIDWSAAADNSTFGVSMKKIDYSIIFNNTFVNVFMMANVVLGLLFLDRFLSNKRRSLYK